MKLAVIPIDDRPICYNLIEDVLKIDKSIQLLMPNRKDLGNLNEVANIENILNWLSEVDNFDYLIVSLDTIAYGGLVPSRRTTDDFYLIKKRIDKLCEIIKQKKCKVFAFSSIMRISNNNVNEEEKEYWSIWGKKIFEYSYYFDKCNREMSYNCVQNKIPKDILEDYLNTRKRNFDINLYYLELTKEKIFDFIVFSKDDCSEYGLNVIEGKKLQNKINELNLNAKIKTGADEIPLLLITRAILENKQLKIKVQYTNKNSTHLISKYEDLSVQNCVKSQLELANCTICEENEDLTCYIHNFDFEQGDLVLGEVINNTNKKIDLPKTPYFICDINNANGADNNFVCEIFKNKIDENFFGYQAYNTSANTIGCGIFVSCVKYFAKKYDENAFLKVEFIRFLDDYSYQANLRKKVDIKNLESVKSAFKPYEDKINNFLKTDFKNISYSFPWKRTFEIEIYLEDNAVISSDEAKTLLAPQSTN